MHIIKQRKREKGPGGGGGMPQNLLSCSAKSFKSANVLYLVKTVLRKLIPYQGLETEKEKETGRN